MMSALVGPTAIAGYAGIVVALLALAVAEALTALRQSWRSPVLDVGDRMIDILAEYPALKELAIDLFGTNDKQALLVGIGVLLTIYAFVMGVVAVRKSLLVGTRDGRTVRHRRGVGGARSSGKLARGHRPDTRGRRGGGGIVAVHQPPPRGAHGDR